MGLNIIPAEYIHFTDEKYLILNNWNDLSKDHKG